MLTSKAVEQLTVAARDSKPISGATHNFYKYPARFSPVFARAAIDLFSRPGDIVLDPYMGGGTTILEGALAGRQTVGSDINQLAVFVARAKATILTIDERAEVLNWAEREVGTIRCNVALRSGELDFARNLHLPQARWIRKAAALMLDALPGHVSSSNGQRFARCAILNAAQWALNGRRQQVSASAFRKRVMATALRMLVDMENLINTHHDALGGRFAPRLFECDAQEVDRLFKTRKMALANLVVTSPPYPGIHMLYHRWQVDGRKETDAPYWISGCMDGAGASYYNFAGRHGNGDVRYFEKALSAFSSVRRAMTDGGYLVQMVAFSRPQLQLPKYISMLNAAGFEECREPRRHRIRRSVPGRQWHANSKGALPSSREVVLVHRAV